VKLIVTQLVKKFTAFLEPEGSLTCSQRPTTGPQCPLPYREVYPLVVRVIQWLYRQVYPLFVRVIHVALSTGLSSACPGYSRGLIDRFLRYLSMSLYRKKIRILMTSMYGAAF